MPKGVYERKPKDDQMSNETAADAQPSTMFPVVLNKNYRPRGDYEIIGYLQGEVKQKDAAGVMRILVKEEFIRGEMKPHQTPGVGYPDKIWAGTHINLPLDEAKFFISKHLADRADAIAA